MCNAANFCWLRAKLSNLDVNTGKSYVLLHFWLLNPILSVFFNAVLLRFFLCKNKRRKKVVTPQDNQHLNSLPCCLLCLARRADGLLDLTYVWRWIEEALEGETVWIAFVYPDYLIKVFRNITGQGVHSFHMAGNSNQKRSFHKSVLYDKYCTEVNSNNSKIKTISPFLFLEVVIMKIGGFIWTYSRGLSISQLKNFKVFIKKNHVWAYFFEVIVAWPLQYTNHNTS